MRTILLVSILAACGPSVSGGDDDGPGTGNGDGGPLCNPGQTFCANEDEVWECNDDGTDAELAETCPEDSVCHNGFCLSPCERAAQEASNVGCHFMAVDLDNEAVDLIGGISNDAAAQQFAIAVANINEYPVRVDVFRNAGRVGQPVQEVLVETRMVNPMDLVQIDLPQREVDGTMGQNGEYVKGSGSGTFVSPHAYRIESNAPVVAYQFQPVIQQFSNDASILIPQHTLGENYMVLGWPTSNPCGPPPGSFGAFDSVPDHTSVTIIGVEDDTRVTVIPTHPVMASGGDSGLAIPATPAGTPIELTINRYDVVNLESDQPVVAITECFNYLDRDGDFTGTQVLSSRPVAVFSSNERGSGTGGAQPPDPPDWDGESCCTDHLEQQMFPTTALGWEFAVSRSPVRSTHPTYEEPDLYRVLATVNGTQVTTTLPPPDDQFTLDAGQWRTFHAYDGFVIEAEGGAVMVGQYLVSQGRVPGGIGDPTFIVFPAAEQHRTQYVFLVPTTFQDNYAVIAMPETASVQLDDFGEFPPSCEERPIGSLNGVAYKQMTCLLTEGVHRLEASEPVGLTVYGYYNVGSYGYPGGSDVKLINPVE